MVITKGSFGSQSGAHQGKRKRSEERVRSRDVSQNCSSPSLHVEQARHESNHAADAGQVADLELAGLAAELVDPAYDLMPRHPIGFVRAADFLLVFVDAFHAVKEDDVLLHALETHGLL